VSGGIFPTNRASFALTAGWQLTGYKNRKNKIWRWANKKKS